MGRLRRFFALLRSKSRVPEIDAAEARRLQEAGAVVIDVRAGFERERGRIPGSRHVPLLDVEARVAELPKDRPIVVHCALGSRSRLAAKRLKDLGFEDVRNLDGGIAAWRRAGEPVEDGPEK